MHSMVIIGRAAKNSLSAGMDRGAQWLLIVLDQHGPMRLNQLAAALELDGSTISRHARSLEESDLISRTPDPDDRRAQRVTLTDEGTRTVREIKKRRRAVIADRLAHWSPEDVATLTDLMTRLAHEIAQAHGTDDSHTAPRTTKEHQ